MTRLRRTAALGALLGSGLIATVVIADPARDDPGNARQHVARGPDLQERSCKHRVEGSGPRTSLAQRGDVVIGPVGFAGLARLASPGALRARRVGSVYLAKAAASVRAGVVATVVVPPSQRGRLSLNYASGTTTKRVSDGWVAVALAACRRDHPAFSYQGSVGEATGFGGGFIVAQPACLPIEVRVKGGGRYRKVVSFGAGRC